MPFAVTKHERFLLAALAAGLAVALLIALA